MKTKEQIYKDIVSKHLLQTKKSEIRWLAYVITLMSMTLKSAGPFAHMKWWEFVLVSFGLCAIVTEVILIVISIRWSGKGIEKAKKNLEKEIKEETEKMNKLWSTVRPGVSNFTAKENETLAKVEVMKKQIFELETRLKMLTGKE